MMKLTNMLKVIETLDKENGSPIADQIASRFVRDGGPPRFFRSSANFVFLLNTGGRKRYLRFNADEERLREQVEAEAGIVKWVSGQGLRVAEPVPSLSKNLVETVETRAGIYHAVLFEQVQGEPKEAEDLDAEGFRLWGNAMGDLHSALEKCPSDLALARPTWNDHFDRIAAQLTPDDSAARGELSRLRSWAENLSVPPEDFGLIHYDFEQDNLFWQGKSAGILDFDDCARYPLAADIAYALRDIFKDGVKPDDPRLLEFAAGYRERRRLNEDLLRRLPELMRVHHLYQYCRLTRSADLPEGYQGTLAGLQAKLKGYINRLRSGFEAEERECGGR